MRRTALTAACALVLLGIELIVWDGDTTSRLGGSAPVALLLVLAAIGAVAATLTWRWPLPAALVAWTLALVAIVVPAWQPFGAVLVALYVVARTLDPQPARLALLVALAPLAVNSWNSAGWTGEVTAATLLPVAGIWLAVALATWAAGRAGWRSDAREEDLRETLRTTEAEVRAQERRLIARELHDIVAHSVTAMVLRAAGAKPLTGDGDDLRAALDDIETSGAQTIRELHRLLRTMHGPVDHANRLGAGLAQLPDLVERTRAAGLTVEVVEEGRRRGLDSSLDLAAYRCVQEALSNAMRHAGANAQVTVLLRWPDRTPGEAEVRVVSRGDGDPDPRLPRSGGFGLVGLSEWMSAIGGRLSTGPTADGFEVRALLPLTEGAAAR